MALANLYKAAMVCGGLCIASAGLAAAQFSGTESFSWPAAFNDFPAWFGTAPNPWLLPSTSMSAHFAILGAWAAIAQLRAPRRYLVKGTSAVC
jgi:hypothetical protein